MISPRAFWSGAIVFILAARIHAGPAPGLELARQLADAGDHAQAAIEYRRLAMEADGASERGAWFWMAGYEYARASRYDQADRMAGQAGEADPKLETETHLLRSENARGRNRLREAVFYLESLAAPERPEAVRLLAAKRLSAIRTQLRDFEGARRAWQAVPGPREEGLAAIAAYEKGRDKSPAVGGLLGLVPGLGYAYSGEYANATRSLLLNALCIWGIAEFAEEEQWAGVAVVGFAEITFYTGSIYGGTDAASRYNERRLGACTRVMEGNTGFKPDSAALPVLSLRYEF